MNNAFAAETMRSRVRMRFVPWRRCIPTVNILNVSSLLGERNHSRYPLADGARSTPSVQVPTEIGSSPQRPDKLNGELRADRPANGGAGCDQTDAAVRLVILTGAGERAFPPTPTS
jgi:hypothetical protein